jgi:hypothetical protein
LDGLGQFIRVIIDNLYWTILDLSTGSYLLLAGERGFDLADLFKAAALLIFLLLGAYGVVQLWRDRETTDASGLDILVFFGLFPLAGVIAMGFHQANVYDTKYLSFVSPLWAVTVCFGAAALLKRTSGRLVMIVPAAALVVSVSRYHNEAIPWKEDWRGASAIIEEHWLEGDVMLQRMNYMTFCLDRYLSFTPERLAAGQTFLPDSTVVDSVYTEFITRNANRLWSVASHDEYGGLMRELLAKRFRPLTSWTPQGVTISLFQPFPEESGQGAAVAR